MYPLEYLFTTNILQSTIEVLHSLCNVRNLSRVLTFDLAGSADSNVQSQLHGGRTREPSLTLRVGSKANSVLTSVSGSECESAFTRCALRNNSVIVIEGFFDCDENLERGVLDPGI